MLKQRPHSRIGLFICFALCPTLVHGQAIVIPRGVEAGNIEKQLQIPPQPQPSDLPSRRYSPIAVPEGATTIRFTLRDLQIDGVTVYQPDVFLSLYQEMVGKEITLAEIYTLADKIRRRYHEDGYILTQVFLPPQEIKGGTVRIRVTEGFISRLRWIGDKLTSDLPAEMLEQLTTSSPFDSNVLEDVMLRLNEVPGISATASLEPLPETEATEGAVGLVIDVARSRYSGNISIDSQASRYLGVWQSNVRAEAYGLFHQTDRISFTGASAYDPGRMRYGAVQYSIPVHRSGTTASISFNDSYTHPGYLLKDLDVFSLAKGIAFSISQPILRSRQQSLTINGQFNMRSQSTDLLGGNFTEDKLRTASIGLNYNRSDGWDGINLLDIQLTRGLNIFNASEEGDALLSRVNGHGDFTKLTLNISRLQTLDYGFSALAAMTAQKSSAELLSSEQFGFGGIAFGRAYNSSEISGDDGIAGSVELRYASTVGSWVLQPYTFYDIGKSWQNQFNGEIVSAASAGLGTRIQQGDLRFDASIAWPLTYTPGTPKLGSENKDPVLSFSLGTAF